jgi:hypothetical protein
MENATNLITSALANVSTVFTSAVTMVTQNEIAMVFIGMGLVAGGIRLFKKVRHG